MGSELISRTSQYHRMSKIGGDLEWIWFDFFFLQMRKLRAKVIEGVRGKVGNRIA